MKWQYYRIGIVGGGFDIPIYAPNLGTAFHLARLARFGSAPLVCHGIAEESDD